MKNVKDSFLLASVFFTGAAVLIIEIVALRILSPYYGNTLYTASSVIGVVLAALSFGYYAGGKLADKHPHEKVFYGIIFGSGLLTVFIGFLKITLLPFLGSAFSIIEGPLFASILLFFIPSFFFGMLSPFAIKLYKTSDAEADGHHNRIGQRAGQVFFCSTMGSIAGSLAAGFLLVPHVGVSFIIVGTGTAVSILGLCGLFWHGYSQKKLMFFIMLLALCGLLVIMRTPGKDPGVVYEKDGVYEKIRVADDEWAGRPARFLFQDRSYSAAMYPGSNELVFDYTKYYALYQLFQPNAKRALVVGGGAYSIPKALLTDSPDMRVDVAEIEPRLFMLAQKYFNLTASDRLRNYTQDGRRLLAESTSAYDAIIVDAYYSLFSIPVHLTTKEFFTLAKSRLSDDGVFVGNFIGALQETNPSFIFSELKTFESVFTNSYFFAVNSLNQEQAQNIIFLGINGDKKIDFVGSEVKNNPNPVIRELPKKNIDLSSFNLNKHNEITDDFAPVEYLVSKMIPSWY